MIMAFCYKISVATQLRRKDGIKQKTIDSLQRRILKSYSTQ
jgi:hypothetical protein